MRKQKINIYLILVLVGFTCVSCNNNEMHCAQENILCRLESDLGDSIIMIYKNRNYEWTYSDDIYRGMVPIDIFNEIEESVTKRKEFKIKDGMLTHVYVVSNSSIFSPDGIGEFIGFLWDRHISKEPALLNNTINRW